MKVIHKYPLNQLPGAGLMEIMTPEGTFKPLTIMIQRGVVTLWAEVDFGYSDPVLAVKRLVQAAGTGHTVRDFLTYVDTLIFGEDHDLVLHYYVDCRPAA